MSARLSSIGRLASSETPPEPGATTLRVTSVGPRSRKAGAREAMRSGAMGVGASGVSNSGSMRLSTISGAGLPMRPSTAAAPLVTAAAVLR